MKTVLSLKDSFSKFVCLHACKTYSHYEITNVLSNYIAIFGAPQNIRCDNALISKELESFCKRFNINLKPTAVYRPQSNGQIERIHREVHKILADLTQKLSKPRNRWCELIPLVANVINNSPHTVTKFCPSDLQLGRLTGDNVNSTNFSNRTAEIFKAVKQRLERARDNQTKEIKGPFKRCSLESGTKVWLFLNKTGPIKGVVVSDLGDNTIIKKLDYVGTRFETITVHKSLVSLRA